jgi:TATA-box binding protein (TBP) (component of TFIID and TFIIIB)
MNAEDQCARELKAIMERWLEESDLDVDEIVESAQLAVDMFLNEDTVDFNSDIDL